MKLKFIPYFFPSVFNPIIEKQRRSKIIHYYKDGKKISEKEATLLCLNININDVATAEFISDIHKEREQPTKEITKEEYESLEKSNDTKLNNMILAKHSEQHDTIVKNELKKKRG
jgi:hypothetical protein